MVLTEIKMNQIQKKKQFNKIAISGFVQYFYFIISFQKMMFWPDNSCIFIM